ncbi:MAG TPA: tRNA (N(6)-L-threonylcarbamoyladenosine(37)-C(2))-methylthiotransferase MtaB [Bacillota bacterium]|jgi:threonylcarbamoyladenosine tRNA methylthiotransferase MtaB|nr:tRNA (N(6)-L-threonylcarbamoyladenosine(37)-C(2))-methylthiotransferase MtaB [Fastidiosipila sp.]HPX92721.1 tRNA (N(6)-L-threonylcarbamoyladenosine(37)-C(2))-methylthiotransferase MtaB [Bacillota bacterium]HQB80618.1 tRNA (N(6)-L-threonylcarbamoyladenosine(37)-C(2))-methylthiotransferase MtaB [Bacillota bacterium]
MIFAVAALGCKTNQYEMDALAEKLRSMGLTPAASGCKADLYVLNTCAVTGEAERKSRQLLRRYRRENPRALIVACGCGAQRSDLTSLADLVIGTRLRDRLPDLILEAAENKSGRPINLVQPALTGASYEELGATAVPGETRAYLKIQDGCDNRCAYCAICLARGPARNRAVDKILEEAEDLARRGFAEIVLTGTNINAFGPDMGERDGSLDLAGLLALLDKVEGIRRIRLGSLESGTITPRFIERLSALDHLCPSFHLSLQSGSDRILRAMKRRDTTDQYREAVSLLRTQFPGAGITTDLIVGFPGENDQDFEQTLAFCHEIGFLRIHVFRFSPRPGTSASAMAGRVSKETAAQRSRILRDTARELAVSAIRDRLGQSREVLVERMDRKGRALGYSPEYIQVIGEAAGPQTTPPVRGQVRAMRLLGVEGEAALASIL